MALKEQINNDLKTALLSGDRFLAEVLRGLKAAILNEEVATGAREQGLSDDSIEQIVAREVKKRFESADMYEKGDRIESAATERKEAELLSKYLPKQLENDELEAIVADKITELGAKDPSQMGLVIGAVKKEVGSSASGAMVAELVKEQLGK